MGSSEYIAVPVTSSLPTLTANGESEPLKKDNECVREGEARRQLLGVPLSTLLTLTGLDETHSLFRKDSRRRCLSFFVTPLAIGSIIFLFIRAMGLLMKEEHDRPSFSYEWAERLAYAFLALHAAGAAFALSKWTRNLFFTDFFSALLKAGKQVPAATRRSGMIYSVLVAAVVAICSEGSAKRVVYDGRAASANNQTTSSWWEATPSAVVVDGAFEVATAAWAALISAVATAIYVRLQSALSDQLKTFNEEVNVAVDSQEGVTSELNERHSRLIAAAALLAERVSGFASIGGIAAIAANAFIMFISISYKEQHSGFTTTMTILWTIVTIGYMASFFITASNVQKEINQTTILLTKNGERLVASEKTEEDCRNRHDILSRTRSAASHVTLMQCLRLTQWRAQFLMAVPPLIGFPLIIVRLLLASRNGEH